MGQGLIFNHTNLRCHGEKFTVIRIFLPFIIAVCVVFSAFFTKGPRVKGFDVTEYEKNLVGYVNVNPDSHLNLRKGPGTEYDVIESLDYGTVFQVTGESVASDGVLWYEVWVAKDLYKHYGYISSEYAGFVSPEEDQEFEIGLIQQGFPESYRDYLRVLHKFYPNWTFEPLLTGLKGKR